MRSGAAGILAERDGHARVVCRIGDPLGPDEAPLEDDPLGRDELEHLPLEAADVLATGVGLPDAVGAANALVGLHPPDAHAARCEPAAQHVGSRHAR